VTGNGIRKGKKKKGGLFIGEKETKAEKGGGEQKGEKKRQSHIILRKKKTTNKGEGRKRLGQKGRWSGRKEKEKNLQGGGERGKGNGCKKILTQLEDPLETQKKIEKGGEKRSLGQK